MEVWRKAEEEERGKQSCSCCCCWGLSLFPCCCCSASFSSSLSRNKWKEVSAAAFSSISFASPRGVKGSNSPGLFEFPFEVGGREKNTPRFSLLVFFFFSFSICHISPPGHLATTSLDALDAGQQALMSKITAASSNSTRPRTRARAAALSLMAASTSSNSAAGKVCPRAPTPTALASPSSIRSGGSRAV